MALLEAIDPDRVIAYVQYWVLQLGGLMPPETLDGEPAADEVRVYHRLPPGAPRRARSRGALLRRPPPRCHGSSSRRTTAARSRFLPSTWRLTGPCRHLFLIRSEETTTVVLESPILSRRVLGEIAAALDELKLEPCPSPLVLTSAHPTIFLAGAHLGEIAGLDQRSCIAYAELGRSIADRLASHPAAVVAAVHGSCSGGGFDLTMACDAVIASPGATFSHPGVRIEAAPAGGGSFSGSTASRSPVLQTTLPCSRVPELDAAAMKARGGPFDRQPKIHEPQARATARRLSLTPSVSTCPSWRLLRRLDTSLTDSAPSW